MSTYRPESDLPARMPTDAEPGSLPEPSLLRGADLALWRGLRLSYADACDLDLRHSRWDYPSVGFISQGSARWTLRRGLVTTETQIGHGLAAVFGTDFEYARSTWICRNARRVVAQILPADYARFDLEDELMQRRIDHRLAVHDPALTGVLRAMVAEIESGCAHGTLYAESLSAGLIRYVQHQAPFRNKRSQQLSR